MSGETDFSFPYLLFPSKTRRKNKFPTTGIKVKNVVFFHYLFRWETIKLKYFLKDFVKLNDIVLRIFPDLIDEFTFEEKLLSEVQDFHKAIHSYTQALDLNPNDLTALLERGKALIAIGKYNEALIDFEHLLQTGKNDFHYIWKGLTNLLLENYETAKSYFTRILNSESLSYKYNEMLPLIYFLRGITNHLLSNLNYALEDYNFVIELKPNYPDFYFFRGFVFREMGMTQEAKNDWRQSAILGKDEALEFLFGY